MKAGFLTINFYISTSGRSEFSISGLYSKTIEDVSGVLTDFFRDFSSPILWNYDITYKGVTDYDCSDSNLFFDQELVCIGKISHKPCDKPKIEEPNDEKVGFLMANPDMLKVNRNS